MAGMVGNNWPFQGFALMDAIPGTVSLTTSNGVPEEFHETPLNGLIKQIEAGKVAVQVGKVFHSDEFVEAHRCVEENRAHGKIVVLTV
jgi:NADPH:quinone reductase-like Zn-dependent oxidoreductase